MKNKENLNFIKQNLSVMTKEQKNENLIAELNSVRKSQKPINSFKTVSEWLAYGKSIAEQKAVILAKLEKNNLDKNYRKNLS